MLRELTCPTCGAPGLEAHQPDGGLVCRFCGNMFSAEDPIACPRCEAVNDRGADYCQRCGEKLKRHCPACSAANWSGAEACARCGHDLGTLAAISQRYASGFGGQLEEHQRGAGALKAEAEATSQKHLAAMWEVDRQRQENLARQAARQQAEHALLYRVLLGAGALLACGALAGVLLWALAR